jgi:hypothetical protein
MFPLNAMLGNGRTNDDRPDYALVVGDSTEELDERAKTILNSFDLKTTFNFAPDV